MTLTRLLSSQLLLSCMIVAVMTSAYADDNDPQHQAERRAELNKQRANVAMQGAMASSQAPGMHFMPIPRIQPATSQNAPQSNAQPSSAPQNNSPQNRPPQNNQPRSQPTIQNAPVGFNKPNNPANTGSTTFTRYQGINQSQNPQSQGSQSWGSHGDHNSDRQRDSHNQGFNNQGFNNSVRFNNNIGFNNTIDQNRDMRFDHDDFHRDPHFNSGWDNHYRMPYRHGDWGGYHVRYVQNWPRHYTWWEHGWREDYQAIDPYWFALITSIAVAQTWSDAEVAQAINDNNLRQQLIYDADVRQQMIDSGYPADQVDYPDNGYGVQYPDQYNQGQYPAQYSQGQVTIQSSQAGYYPPPNQPAPSYSTSNPTSYVSPNSPLYTGRQNTNLASGEQIANLNANKNALFFCTAGNKPAAIQAFHQIQSTDMSVWKTMERFDRCSAWATP